jgi:hypothetical protein
MGLPWKTIQLNLTDNWLNKDYGSNNGKIGEE